MIRHFRRSPRMLLLTCAALILMATVALWFHTSSTAAFIESTFPSFERIDRLCQQQKGRGGRGGVCWEVMDRRVTNGSEEVVIRSLELVLSSGTRFVESAVRIRPKDHNTTFAVSDTRLWAVEGEELREEYQRGMMMTAFLTRTLRVGRRRERKQVAFIGGGGAAMMHHLNGMKDGITTTIVEKQKEVVTLAKRWFNLGGATIVSQDGVEWLEERSEGNETRFDIVFLDACVRVSVQHCPVSTFMTVENVRRLHETLVNDTRALLVVNFEIYTARKWELLHQQMDVLLAHFPVCLSIELKRGASMVVGCLTRPLPFYDPQNVRASLDAGMGFIVDQYADAAYELQYGKIFGEMAVHALIDGKRQSVQHPTEKMV